MDKKEDITLKEFMEWFVSEYDGHWLPTDYTHTIDKLEGYCVAIGDKEGSYIFHSALELLKDAQNLLANIKQGSDWKYRG